MNKFIVTDYGVKTDSKELQTESIQRVFDLCKAEGGTVVFPKGEYHVASLRMWSDMTIYLEKEATIIGSDEAADYIIFDVPEGITTATDRDLLPSYFTNKDHYHAYRKAIISAYGENNIAIIGEEGSLIDGSDCFDEGGEEGFRGPHGIFFTNCTNVTLRGYTIQNTGNFMHQTDKCKNIVFDNVTCLAGHDGTHMHLSEDILIENCRFITGDDCIAGINMHNLTVRNCELNTSCQTFRVGGSNIKIENCHLYGPGYYPHRMTVVRGKRDYLSREEGRHNLFRFFIYFSSDLYPDNVQHSISFKDCVIENGDMLFHYICDDGNSLQWNSRLEEISFENCKISGIEGSSLCEATSEKPLKVNLKNVEISFTADATGNNAFGTDTKNVTVNILD